MVQLWYNFRLLRFNLSFIYIETMEHPLVKYLLFSHVMDKNNHFGSSNDTINITFQNLNKKKILRFKQFRKKKERKKRKQSRPVLLCARGPKWEHKIRQDELLLFICFSLHFMLVY